MERPWHRYRPVPRYEPQVIVVPVKCEFCGYTNALSDFDIPRSWQQWQSLGCEKCRRGLAALGLLGFAGIRARYTGAVLREELRRDSHWLRYLPRRLWRIIQRLLGLGD